MDHTHTVVSPIPIRRILRELEEIIFRRGLYRYDFFDGTNKGWLVFEYVLAKFKDDWISAYEDAIARHGGVPYAISFGAGRMALYAILEALDIGNDDEVILPAYTCVVVPNAILYRGAKPVYVDICQDNFNIDVSKIEKVITPRTKAILAQHTFGQPCDIESISEIARRHGLTVIEDCAHAFGASFKGRRLGAWGDVAFVSTDHSKVLSTSIGGFVICASRPLAEKIRRIQGRSPYLPWHCRLRIVLQYSLSALLNRPRIYWFGRILIGMLQGAKLFFYFWDELKVSRPKLYPVRLSNFQAFVGWHEIQDLERNIRHRRDVASHYREILAGESGGLVDGAYLRYSLLVNSPERWEQTIGKYFTVGRWFSSVAQGRMDRWGEIEYRPGLCPVAEFIALHIINFPTHFLIDGKAVKRFRDLVARNGLKTDIIAAY